MTLRSPTWRIGEACEAWMEIEGVTGAMEGRPVEAGDFDAFVGGLDYPVFVVTAVHEDVRAGCLVGFTTQASIDPPRFLVCLSVKNHTYSVARHALALAVHVLASSQHELAELFGSTTGDEVDKFSRCRWVPGPHGVPLLEDCERLVVGRVVEQQPFGDHVGFLLAPTLVDIATGRQGLTFKQARDIQAGHPA